MSTAWKSTQLPASRCPYCDVDLDAAGSYEGKTPDPGDLTVCVSCASLLAYGDDMRLRKVVPADLADLPEDAKQIVRTYQQAVRGIDRRGLTHEPAEDGNA